MSARLRAARARLVLPAPKVTQIHDGTDQIRRAVTALYAAGEAKQTREVIDVAQLLARSVKLREQADMAAEGRSP